MSPLRRLGETEPAGLGLFVPKPTRDRGLPPLLLCLTCFALSVDVRWRPLCLWRLVESAWSAVSALPLVRFSRPLAEPAVRVSTQRALRGSCRQALVVAGQGLGIWLPRHWYRVIDIAAMGRSSISPALGCRHCPVAVTSVRRTSVQFQWCRRISIRISRRQAK
jgi:hypothetical protein